jgi:DNA polymerase (family 10)
MAEKDPISKEQVVEILEEISWLLELKQENRFKIIAFENAARILAGHPSDIKTLVESGELELLKGIGKGHIARIVHELYETGKCLEYEKLKKGLPPTLFDLFHIPGLGPRRVKLLYEKLGVKTVADLQKACEQDRLLDFEGFGKKSQENILRGIRQVHASSGQFLISQAMEEGQKLTDYLKKQPGVLKIEVAGSVRRCKEMVHDIDVLAVAQDPCVVHQAFDRYPAVERIIASGETKSSILLKSGMQCDLRTVTQEEFPTALYYFTGSKEHNVALHHGQKAQDQDQ